MRRIPSTRQVRLLLASAMLAFPCFASADLPSDGSPDEGESAARARARFDDEAPSDEVAESPPAAPSDGELAAGDDEPGSAARRPSSGRRRWTDGPRRVPAPRGASLERANRLGLGTTDAAHTAMYDPTPRTWRRAAGSAAPRELRWPVDVGALGRGFGYVRHDRPEVRHNGIDVATPRGMVIRAAAEGIVVYSDNGLRGYGNCVIVAHANGWVTLYGHADRTTVQAGYRVRRGERIGFVGSTGRSDGPHLHFELRIDGQPVDPLPHFAGEPWVRGRTLLAELRRDGGGHRRDHLGEITADYGADAPARALATRGAPPARRAPEPAPRPARESSAEPPTETVEVPASVQRLLARGPSTRDRDALRAHPVDALESPIRLEVGARFRDAALFYAAPTSTNVRAAAAGRVAYVGRGVRDDVTTVVLVHANGWVTLYSGVLDATVAVGDLLAVGDRIAIVRDTRVGLAFELLARGRALDPREHLVVRPPVVASRE